MRIKKVVSLVCAVLLALQVNAAAAGLSVMSHASKTWDADATVRAAREMKSEWMRDEIRWKQVEWTKGNFALPTDAVWSSWVNKAAASGIKPLCILGFGNGSYQVNGDEYTSLHMPTNGTRTGTAAQKEQEYWNAWIRYVTLVATTYQGVIKAYEVWNEPNLAAFNNDIDAENYAKLYLATRSVIKSIDPDAVVLCGSISGGGQEGIAFIGSVLDYIKGHGGLSQIDAFSIHLYTHGSIPESSYLTALNTLYTQAFAAKGYTGDIWMTENGTYTGTAQNASTEAEQAALAVRQTAIWDSFLKSKGIHGENVWYDLINDGTDLTDPEQNFGLMYQDFSPKSAYTAASLFNTLVKGMDFNALYQSSDKYIAEYTDGERYTFVAWKTGSGTGNVTVTVPHEDTKVYSLAGEVVQTISGTGNKAVTVSSSPVIVHSAPLPPEFSGGTVVSYNAGTKKVSVSGTIENFRGEQELSFLVVPHGTTISNQLNPLLIGYVGSVKTSSASFSHQFGLPAWYAGKADVYIGGYGFANSADSQVTLPDQEYVYVASIDVNESSLSASAAFRNFTASAKAATIIVATYKEGKMADVKLETVTVPAKTYVPAEFQTTGFVPTGEADEVKAFVWSDTSGLVPLIEADVK